jgi:hypothetical protein
MDIPVFELFPDGSLNAISLVTDPAIEEVFLKFNSEEQPVELKLSNEEKHIVTGPALIPNKNIIRYDKDSQPYYVFFSESTIEELSQTFLKDFKNFHWDLQHSENAHNKVFITESWLVTDPKNDKSNALGFSLPVGSWMVSAKIEDEDIWNRIKSGELRGFSIDGAFFAEKENTIEEDYDALLDQVKNILSQDDNL